jgi:hypothetical protein
MSDQSLERVTMRILTALVVLFAVAWGGYWFVGARTLDNAARDWFTAEQAAGGAARYESLSVAGFPNRFDLTVDGLHLESPDGSMKWDAPFAQIFALTYKPWHLIAALPNEQTIFVADQAVTLTSSYLQGSLVVSPNTSAALNRVTIVGRDLIASSTAGWGGGAGEINLASRRDPADDLTHEIGVRVTDLALAPELFARYLGDADLPPVIGLIHADANVTLTAPLDRYSAEIRPRVSRIDLVDSAIVWGGLSLKGKGEISADEGGFAKGRVDWTLTNWQSVPAALVAAGVIKPGVERTVRGMLQAMAAQSPDPNALVLPMVFQSGRVSLGPLPLGQAPRLN